MSGVAAARRSAARVGGGSGGGDDDYECRACYGVSVACVSLLLFCVLAASVSVTKACAVAGLAVLLFGVIGWFVPLCGAGGGRGAGSGRRGGDAVRVPARRRGADRHAAGVRVRGPRGGRRRRRRREQARRQRAVRGVPGGRGARRDGAAAAGVRPPLPQGLRRHVAALAHHLPALPLRGLAAETGGETCPAAAGASRRIDVGVCRSRCVAAGVAFAFVFDRKEGILDCTL